MNEKSIDRKQVVVVVQQNMQADKHSSRRINQCKQASTYLATSPSRRVFCVLNLTFSRES